MRRIVTAALSREADLYTGKHLISGEILMDRAAHAVLEEAEEMCRADSRILIVCGKGHNGGDGFVTGELLLREHPLTEVFFEGKEEELSEENARLFQRFTALGGRRAQQDTDFASYHLIIDALFGTGLSRPVTDKAAELIERVNQSHARILSIDIPSGVNADNGRIMGTAVQADTTVTMQFLKPGLLLYPGAQLTGRLITAKIGIVLPESAESADFRGHTYFTLTEEEAASLLPARTRRSHKGMYGHSLIAAGNSQTGGCALLAAMGAFKTGTGLVTCLTDRSNRDALLTAVPEALFADRTETDDPSGYLRLSAYTAAAAGPGIGLGKYYTGSISLTSFLLREFHGPLLLDADALTVLAREPECMQLLKEREAPTVLTPHMGEMSRLTGLDKQTILSDPVKCAVSLAEQTGAVVLLKDAATIVTDGKRIYINRSGCDGMAAAGAGDVLTGIASGFLAQHMDAFEAVCVSAFIHGLAGEAAERKLGARSMTAGDIVRAVPEVLCRMEQNTYRKGTY